MSNTLQYQLPGDEATHRNNERWGLICAIVAIAINLVCSGFICYCWLQLWWLPRGTGIRPMGLAAISLLNAVINPLISVALGFGCALLGRRKSMLKKLALLTILLGIGLPIVFPMVIVRLIVSWHGLVMEP